MNRAKGMFISYYQVSFTNLGNLDYILQRTSDGLWTDQRYYEMLPEVQTINRRGAVHNFRPDKPWQQQADKFIELSKGKGFKLLCGDYESHPLNQSTALDFYRFLCYLKAHSPTTKIVFYCTIYTLRDYMLPTQGMETEFGPVDWYQFPLWLARYYGDIDPDELDPSLKISNEIVWNDEWTFWQYWADGNEKGSEYGCGSRDTNLDVFNGTVDDLDEFLHIDGDVSVDPDHDHPEYADKGHTHVVGLDPTTEARLSSLETHAHFHTKPLADADHGHPQYVGFDELESHTHVNERIWDKISEVTELARANEDRIEVRATVVGLDLVNKKVDLNRAECENIWDALATHQHLDVPVPIEGTFWQRLRWLVTGRSVT